MRFSVAAVLLLYFVPSLCGTATGDVPVLRVWSGVCRLEAAPRVIPAVPRRGEHHRVIRTVQEYHAFIATIPQRKGWLAALPPNLDPLREKPPLDFSRQMLLVVVGPDPAVHLHPKLERINRENGSLVVRYRLPDRFGEEVRFPGHLGYYRSLLVRQSSLPVRFVRIK